MSSRSEKLANRSHSIRTNMECDEWQHHANLPLAGLLHDQPVGDVTHFTGSRADALCDFLTHALFVVQSTVYRARAIHRSGLQSAASLP